MNDHINYSTENENILTNLREELDGMKYTFHSDANVCRMEEMLNKYAKEALHQGLYSISHTMKSITIHDIDLIDILAIIPLNEDNITPGSVYNLYTDEGILGEVTFVGPNNGKLDEYNVLHIGWKTNVKFIKPIKRTVIDINIGEEE